MATIPGNLAGNWPSYVFIKVKRSSLGGLIEKTLDLAASELGADQLAKFRPSGGSSNNNATTTTTAAAAGALGGNVHISLSRQFYLRTHHIDSFVQALGLALGGFARVPLRTDSKHFMLTNDDETKRFLCIPVHDATGSLRRLVDATSETLVRFRQLPYYENPILHISLVETSTSALLEASTLSSRTAVREGGMNEEEYVDLDLEEQAEGEEADEESELEEIADGHYECSLVATAVFCNIGNRCFRLDLGTRGNAFREETAQLPLLKKPETICREREKKKKRDGV